MRGALTTLLALALAGALATPAAAAPKKNPKSPEETVAYWTAERMKNAKPRERAKPPGGPGGGGGGGKISDWSKGAVPAPYTGHTLKNGKLFMTFDNGNYVCSGTAVDAADGVNLVWTAGHCVTDGIGPDGKEHPATNVMFVPGYHNGSAPHGRWAYSSLDSTPGWVAQGDPVLPFRYDVGAARVHQVDPADETKRTNATFAGTIGTRSIEFGQTPTIATTRFISYGYPAAGRFTGESQYYCSSPFRAWDDIVALDPMKISCDMTGGSSGGAWILDRSANNVDDPTDPLVSVNSYGYQGEKNTMYGPFMKTGDDNQAQDLYETMSRIPRAD